MLLACALCFSSSLLAAPQLQQGSIVNAASFAIAGAPHAPIAPGSLFTVFGVDVGPADPAHATSFPLPLQLGGVSIKITAGGQDYDAVVLFAVSSQVSAILPSSVPPGEATLVLSYDGQQSNPITFPVAAHQAGVFTRSQNGSGIAVVQNYFSPEMQPTNTVDQAAAPGQIAILWTTGLGASLNLDDRNPPAPGNVIEPSAIQVYVGGKAAEVQYAGRSGCCAGVDQINFVVPDGVEGCVVPVVVTTNDVASNFTAISVSSDGVICNDPGGLSRSQIQTLVTLDTIRTGVVSLNRVRSRITLPVIGTLEADNDVGNGSFQEFSVSGLLDAIGMGGSPAFAPGACMVTTVRSGDAPGAPGSPQQFLLRTLDAGPSISVSGPQGPRQLLQSQDEEGAYFANLNDPFDPGASYLQPGEYSLDNGAGGAQVGSFTIHQNVPSFLQWTNRESITVIPRSQPFTVTWNPGDSAAGTAAIFGTSSSVPTGIGSVLFCFADLAAGQFTIPAHVLSAMVASDSGPDVDAPAGSISLGAYSHLTPFEAPGLDLGIFFISTGDQHLVPYQ
ncbi:MAG: hypothetical protein KIT83_21770 [Bryobacterales bacterium]|nr:hypothetical protein [Bryobacterales bacterium]